LSQLTTPSNIINEQNGPNIFFIIAR